MMSLAAPRTSCSVVCRPVLSRSVPTAYEVGTSIALSTDEMEAWLVAVLIGTQRKE